MSLFCLISLACFILSLKMAGDREPGLPNRKAVLDRAAQELTSWRAKLAEATPRLFFDAESWRSIRQRYLNSTGRERYHFDRVLNNARQITFKATPLYKSPAEVSLETGLSPFEAVQELWQRQVGNDIVALSFALLLQDDKSVSTKLHEMVVVACDYPQWGLSFNAPNCDLAAGHVARGIAIAYDWHRNIWNKSECQIIRETIRSRIGVMSNAAYGGIFWAGKYVENHNNVDVAAIGLCGLAFFDEFPETSEWTALALTNFESVALKSNADGSSEEGVPYWSYGMAFTLQYIEGVRHVLPSQLLYDQPYFRNTIATRLHASSPNLAGTTPWGDAPPRDYYGPHQMLYRLADQYNDGAGQFLANHLPFLPGGVDGHDDSVWTALWYNPAIEETIPDRLDYFAGVAGTVSTRSGWDDNDYQLCFKAGVTNHNHSHLDAGALALCIGDEWLMTTPGYGLGKGDPDFWDNAGKRWTFFSNSTESHCTLLVNGRNQRFDHRARGQIDKFIVQDDWVWASADLTKAYDDVIQVRRDVLHRRGDYILILDEVRAANQVTVEWLAQVPNLLTVSVGRLFIIGKAGSLTIQAAWPAGAHFNIRLPNSGKVDVDPNRMTTYAIAQQGVSVRFVTVLFPFRGANVDLNREPQIAVTESEQQLEISISGVEWQDQIRWDIDHAKPSTFTAKRTDPAMTASIFSSHSHRHG